MAVIQVIAGILLLGLGGELLVRGAVAIAGRLHWSPLLVGVFLVGFGSSAPELVTSIRAALVGAPGIALGNVLGSNTGNILLIAGLAAAARPVDIPRRVFHRDGGVFALSAILLALWLLTGGIGRPAGLLMLGLLFSYLLWICHREKRSDATPESGPAGPVPVAVLQLLAGFGSLFFGARLLVDGGITLARLLDLSETVIGVTVIALGTSMPELAVTVAAILRRQGDIVIGNILGSNIFNTLGVLGVTAAVHPIAVPDPGVRLDLYVMLAATLVFGCFAASGTRIVRREGLCLLAAYGAYVTWRLLG